MPVSVPPPYRSSLPCWRAAWLPTYHIRASSHSVKSRGCQPNSSYFWARGEGKSPLKYIMFHLLARVWVSIFDAPKLFSRGQTFGAKSAKKCCHIGTLEAFHFWSLAISVKAQRSTFCSSPVTLLDFLHLSIDRPSVKAP